MTKVRKYAVDIHGVIADKPDFWRDTIEAWLRMDHRVHILSGPPKEQIQQELHDLNIIDLGKGGYFRYSGKGHPLYAYLEIFSIVDYHREIGTPMIQDSRGNWHLSPPGDSALGNYLWDRTKADYCLKHSIDCIFDDSDAYRYFVKSPTAYCRFFSMDKRKHHINPDKID
jgi:hypothetical protein